ncbi:MAG: calcium-binding protein [Limimaricola soesokkakensis]|uniref:calcium-binding protein n=1 Tax=Limimaricola soesokkakensis TaxID=1343159 RepID=UPI004059943A
MPTYRSPAFLLSFNEQLIGTGEFKLSLPTSSFAYELSGSWLGPFPEVLVPADVTPTAISFEGEPLAHYADMGTWAYLGDISWGAGRETRILLLELGYETAGEGVDIMVPISGDVMPDLGRGGIDLLDELLWVTDYNFDGSIRTGPLAEGREIDAADLFIDATRGRVRQGDDRADRLLGNRRDDLLVGQDGNDLLKGKGGADTMLAGDGNDRLLGGKGNDVLSGWAGRDVLSGQGGDDLIFGGNGRDRIKGQNGNDEIWAEDGNDRLIGGRGDDHLNGGGGSDDFVFGKKHGDDTIFDFDTAEDRLVLDDKLWRATLDAETVVERFAEATKAGTLFDFGHKGSVLLEDVSMDSLADRTALIEAIEIA